MSIDRSLDRLFDENDPLAGAPDEVLAAFVALGGRAARMRAAKHVAAPAAAQSFADASKLKQVAPSSSLLNRKI